MKKIFVLFVILMSSKSVADWATVPDLESRYLWQLVAEGRAEVISSVGFGLPDNVHSKQTVFKILKASKSESGIKWAISPNGSYRPVMCTESWESSYKYRGSSCAIPGCTPDNEKCIKEITKNL